MGQINVSRRDARTIECRFSGQIGVADVDTAHAQIAGLIAASSSPTMHTFLVFETSTMTGFAADIRAPTAAMLRALHKAGIELLVGVATSAFARMTGYAIAMDAGIPLRTVPSPEAVGVLLIEETRKRLLRGAPMPPLRAAGRAS